MRKISKKIIVLLLVAVVAIAGGIYIGLSEPENVSGGTGNLQAGDWVFLDVSSRTDWENNNAYMYFKYQYSSGNNSGEKSILMLKYEEHMYCVKIPSDIKTGGGFKFYRVLSDSDQVHENAPQNGWLSLNNNSNVYKIDSNNAYSGSWVNNQWKNVEISETLKAGDYILLDITTNNVNWTNDNARIYLKYIDSNGNENKVEITSKKDEKYKVMIPTNIGSDGQFKFARFDSSGSSEYNRAPGPTEAWLNFYTSTSNKCNVFTLINWRNGNWTAYEDVPVNNAGKTIYFLNMEGTAIEGLKAQFTVSGENSVDPNSVPMIDKSADMSGLYSIVIPGDADYDTVEFVDSSNKVLATQKIMEDEYDPDNGIDTYFYNVTKTSGDDTDNISFWGTLPTAAESISGKELYIDAKEFAGDNVTIKVGNSDAVTLTTDEDDNTIYRYVIPSELNATQKTIITITANNSTSYNFLWSDLNNKDKVTISNSGVAEVSAKYVSNVKVMYFINMGSTPIGGNIEAKFNSTTTATTVKIKTMTLEEGFDGLPLYRVTVPSGYDIVQFTSNGVNLGVVQKIEGGSYSSDLNNTFYYNTTEKSNGNVSVWYEYPEGTESIAEKKLYFEAESFKGDSVTIQIGSTTGTLSAEVNDNEVLSYTIPDGSSATQRTKITVNVDGTLYHFLWTDKVKNKAVVSSDVATVSERYFEGHVVFFDATLSKLSYENDGGDLGIPLADSEIIYYHAWYSADDSIRQDGTMEKLDDYTKNGNTWKDVYMVELNNEAIDRIIFYSHKDTYNYNIQNCTKTADLIIPTDKKNPCFYADTSDSAIYTKSFRGGYWGEVYNIRDVQAGKETDIVEVQTQSFDKDSTILYINTTLYDYYSDYELNGLKRDGYVGDDDASHRVFQPFRQFNQALSGYYEDNKTDTALYWGHVEWENGPLFSEIAGTLDLYGYDDYYKFVYENNSTATSDGGKCEANNATIGLTSNMLSSGSLMLNANEGESSVLAPFFDEDFLTGKNSKNAVLGEVYKDVAFPFVKKTIDVDENNVIDGKDVDYWYFDSADSAENTDNKNLQLRKSSDTSDAKYFLASIAGDYIKGGFTDDNATEYANYFPFNTNQESGDVTQLNYGFGQKLEFTFRLTEGGKVKANDGVTEVPIVFEFDGDDDVWVFIDGELILDIGGGHSQVKGTINFKTGSATVSGVKPSGSETIQFLDPESEQEFYNEEHTLTMYYMERGLWESNMKIVFNFPIEDKLSVEKEVDTSKVNVLFRDLFDAKSIFKFNIRNQATHYDRETLLKGDEPSPEIFNDDFSENTIEPLEAPKKFQYEDQYINQTNVVHWYAVYEDLNGENTEDRWGIVYPDTGKDTHKDLLKQNIYFQFEIFYPYNDTAQLSHMRIEIEDSGGHKIGGTLNGKTYGNSSITSNAWTRLQIDMRKFDGYETINFGEIAKVKFAYDYPRDIYLDDFVFKPAVNATALVGFTTHQHEIPDYNSATTGKLENTVDALFSTKLDDGSIEYGRVDEDGMFVLANGQKITFSNQFRKGSYIYLKEDINEDVFDVSWKLYEGDIEVTDTTPPTENSVVTGGISLSSNNKGTTIADGRIEKYLSGTDEVRQEISNKGYTADGNAKIEQQNGEETEIVSTTDTIVFRSYDFPDSAVVGIDLTIKQINTVKTGSLKITKQRAEETKAFDANQEFTIRIEFSDIAGLGLETNPIVHTIKLKEGQSEVITGIPAKTVYSITEVLEDGSDIKLESITQGKIDGVVIGNDGVLINGATVAHGQVGADSDDSTANEFIFTNSWTPTISLNLKKLWKTNAGDTALTEGLPEYILVQLQRKTATEENFAPVKLPESENGIIRIEPGYSGWVKEIVGLNIYADNSTQTNPYIYRVVEVKEDGNDGYEEVDRTFWDGGNEFEVSYSSESIDLTGVISDTRVYEITITNTSLEYFNFSFTKVTNLGAGLSKIFGAEFVLYEYKGEVSLPTYTDVMNAIADIEGGTSSDLWVKHELKDAPEGEEGDAIYALSDLNRKSIYYLVETKVPTGMQLPSGCWKVEFVNDSSKENVKITPIPLASASDMPAIGYQETVTHNGIKGWFITNLEQWDIPETGGIGLTYPYMAGICLMLIAVVWGGTLYYRDRRRQKT